MIALPVWSPNGKKTFIPFVKRTKKTQLYLRWMVTGLEARLSNLNSSPGGISWSPDGKWVAFSMFVEKKKQPARPITCQAQGSKMEYAAKIYGQTKI